jgi:pyrroline-5-carboxylate reductase
MGKTGFVGFGNMGGTMVRALLKAEAITEGQTIIFTRTREKLKEFVRDYPQVEIAQDIHELGPKCSRVFICTGTRELKSVLTQLVKYLPADTHVITIAGTIETKCLESIFPGKITKIMPTMISEVGEGVTLVCHNSRTLAEDREFIRAAFSKVGKVKEIGEDRWDLTADLTSCAPAFYAAILRALVEAAGKHGDFSADELRELILPTCYGTAKMLMEKESDFNDLIARVATKGGIAEEGTKVLDSRLPEIFDQLLTVTLAKRQETKQLMREQFGVV